MPGRDDDNLFESGEHREIYDLLAQDRRQILRTANERIASGMYERIARAHVERKFGTAWRPQWQLGMAAVVLGVLTMIWIALPKKSSPASPTQSTQAPARNAHFTMAPTNKVAVRRPAHVSTRRPFVVAHETVPRRATFPINVAATEEERLLMQLASQNPKQLQAMSEAMAASQARAEAEKQEFDHWLQQRGENR